MKAAKIPALFLLTAVALAGSAVAQPVKLKVDPDHSSVGFSVRHLFTRVQGRFTKFGGTIDLNEQAIETSKVAATIQAASIDTNVADRDNDLRSKRFFDAAKFPTLDFASTRIEKVSPQRFKVYGALTMHGVAREVVLDAELLGSGKDPWGNRRYGFHAATTVNRKDFGMQWNETLETGGVLVGDDIEIVLDIEAVPAS